MLPHCLGDPIGVKNDLLSHSTSGNPSSDSPGASNQASSVSGSEAADWFVGARPVARSDSSDFPSLVVGTSTSIATGGVGSGGGLLAASGSKVGVGGLASLGCWLASRALAFLFSFSCSNFLRVRASCASVFTFVAGVEGAPDVPGTGAGSRGGWGSGTLAFAAVAWWVAVVVGWGRGCLDVELFRLLLGAVDDCGRSRRSMSTVRSLQPRL